MSNNMSDEEYLYTLFITVNVTHPALVLLNPMIIWDWSPSPVSVCQTTLLYAGIMHLRIQDTMDLKAKIHQHYACYRSEAKNTYYQFK